MELRRIISNIRQLLPNILVALIAIGGAGAALWFLPNRTAAVILGILAGIALTYLVIQQWQRTTQIALFWLSAGVVADAAYARLNDQAPVTIASLLVKLGESVVKLGDILIRSMGVAGPDLRVKVTAVTPDFIWALILVTTLLMAIGLAGRQRATAAKPELRRAA